MSNEAESTEKYDLEDLGAEMSSRKAGRGLWLLVTMDVVFGLLDLILCGFFVYWSFAADGVVLFAWHPSLLSIGVSFLSMFIHFKYTMVRVLICY